MSVGRMSGQCTRPSTSPHRQGLDDRVSSQSITACESSVSLGPRAASITEVAGVRVVVRASRLDLDAGGAVLTRVTGLGFRRATGLVADARAVSASLVVPATAGAAGGD
jgi:hypothetical protein